MLTCKLLNKVIIAPAATDSAAEFCAFGLENSTGIITLSANKGDIEIDPVRAVRYFVDGSYYSFYTLDSIGITAK